MVDNQSSNQNNNSQNQNNNSNSQNASNNTNSYAGGGKKIAFGADGGCTQEDCDKIKKGLEDCGNTVHFTCIGPNQESYLQGHGADFCIYYCNGVAPATIWSFVHNQISRGNLPFTIFAYPGWPPYHTEEGGELTSIETIRAVPFENEWDANYMTDSSTATMQQEGKGATCLGDYLDANSQYVGICWGASPEELAQNICSGACGGGGSGSSNTTGGSAQIKDKTFENCIKRICAATDSIFLVENNAAVLFPYTDWMAFTLRQQINKISAKDMDPDLFEINYNTEGFYNKVTTVWGADEEDDPVTSDQTEEEEKKTVGNTTTIQKTMPTGGTQMSEQYDPLVNIYGELEKKVTTNFPNEETEHYVMNALLIQYIRDFNNSCRVRAINNQKFVGGTFYAVENPYTKESEMFYLNSYTLFKNKNEPITTDLEFKYGPEGAEELLDYQAYGGGGGQTSAGSGTEEQIWKEAAKIHYGGDCSSQDPTEAYEFLHGHEGESNYTADCYGMSSYLHYRFNKQANIPCRVVGNSAHHVVMLYKNNAWQKTINEYRSYGFETNFKWREDQDTSLILEADNPPAGSTNTNASGNTANTNTNK